MIHNENVRKINEYNSSPEGRREFDEEAKRLGFMTQSQIEEMQRKQSEESRIKRKQRFEEFKKLPKEKQFLYAFFTLSLPLSRHSKEETKYYLELISEAAILMALTPKQDGG